MEDALQQIKRKLGLTSINTAKKVFSKVGLPIPYIPAPLEARIKERKNWTFSSRKLLYSPYGLPAYTYELYHEPVDDYVILAHSGHGINSYAIQFYLVYQNLAIFLQIGWGGVYMDNNEQAKLIGNCFSNIKKIIKLTENKKLFADNERLIIVGSDHCGSYWQKPGENVYNDFSAVSLLDVMKGPKPIDVFNDALNWLKNLHKKMNYPAASYGVSNRAKPLE